MPAKTIKRVTYGDLEAKRSRTDARLQKAYRAKGRAEVVINKIRDSGEYADYFIAKSILKMITDELGTEGWFSGPSYSNFAAARVATLAIGLGEDRKALLLVFGSNDALFVLKSDDSREEVPFSADAAWFLERLEKDE